MGMIRKNVVSNGALFQERLGNSYLDIPGDKRFNLVLAKIGRLGAKKNCQTDKYKKYRFRQKHRIYISLI